MHTPRTHGAHTSRTHHAPACVYQASCMPGGARGLDDGRLLERLRHDGMVRVHVANASRQAHAHTHASAHAHAHASAHASAHALTQPRTSPHTSSPLPHRLVPKEQITLQAGLANGLIIAGIILMTIYGPHCDSVRSIPQLRARTLPRHSLALTTRSFSLDLHPRPPPSPSPLTTHRSPLTSHLSPFPRWWTRASRPRAWARLST